jgi:hypothetical protein
MAHYPIGIDELARLERADVLVGRQIWPDEIGDAVIGGHGRIGRVEQGAQYREDLDARSVRRPDLR